MKKSFFRKFPVVVPGLILALVAGSSCNKKDKSDDDDVEQIAVTASTVAVKSFSIKPNSKVLANLDSVFFSIDLNNGVIFNADSLPMGTDVSKLVPVITFMTTMSRAELVFTKADGTEKTVNYLEKSTDSIDFTHPVLLNVVAPDTTTKYSYRISVNIHTQKPDSLMWDRLAVAKLPSRMPVPKLQKTVVFNDVVTSVIEESDGSYTLAKGVDMMGGEWEKSQISLPAGSDITTLTATGDALWMLDNTGTLHSSPDGVVWNATSEKWVSIIGPYLDSVLGLKASAAGGLEHCHYPANGLIADSPMSETFPLYGRSALMTVASKWSPQPTVFFFGGEQADNSLSSSTWAFDGSTWTEIGAENPPAIKGASLIPYVTYRNQSDIIHQYPYDSYLIIGGVKKDGDFNENVYISHDNGVTWKEGSQLMMLPDYFPHLCGADAIVAPSTLSASLSEYWTSKPSPKAGLWLKPVYEINGTDISWQCPYIYIIGGNLPGGELSDSIWRGVLARLAFTPVF